MTKKNVPLDRSPSLAFDAIENMDELLNVRTDGVQTLEAVDQQPVQPSEELSQSDVPKGVLVHDPRSQKSRMGAMLVPAFLLMLAATGLTIYRIRQPDWHWGPTGQPPTKVGPTTNALGSPEATITQPNEALSGNPSSESSEQPIDSQSEKSAEVVVGQIDPDAENSASGHASLDSGHEIQASDGENQPLQTNKPEAQDGVLPLEKDRSAQPIELADIEREAERVRAERKELEDHKRDVGEKMSQEAKKRPRFAPGFRPIDPRDFARQNEAIQRMLRQQMEFHDEQVQAMLRAQGRFLGGRDIPGFGRNATPTDFDRAFDLMQKEMDAFEAEALRQLKPPKPGVQVLPPAPDEVVQGGPEPENQAPDAAWPPQNKPKIRKFRYVDPRTGATVQGFQMQMNSNGR